MAAVPLIALDELKAVFGVRPGVTDKDARLGMCIRTASANIEAVCRQSFAASPRTEYFSSRPVGAIVPELRVWNECGTKVVARDQSFTLGAAPVDLTAPFTLSYDPNRVFDADSVVDPSNYTVDAATGRVTVLVPSIARSGAIKVEYSAGFAVGTDGTLSDAAPADLKDACVLQATYLYNKLDRSNLGLDVDRSQDKGAGRARFVTHGGLVLEAMMLLTPYLRGALVGPS